MQACILDVIETLKAIEYLYHAQKVEAGPKVVLSRNFANIVYVAVVQSMLPRA